MEPTGYKCNLPLQLPRASLQMAPGLLQKFACPSG
ncbi:hypothetical protein T10_409 [Trichinella papuae]|uniref:Uncharacterized protein n=1 Tax=Trichinella papuae TaxID=268474 RepID=A0A0V1LYE5_9BILA|nr:hypothetical protein T10_409 [Trichinella papuae]